MEDTRKEGKFFFCTVSMLYHFCLLWKEQPTLLARKDLKKKALKISNRQGMRKVRSKLSVYFSSFSSSCALDSPFTHSTGTKPDPTATRHNSSSPSPRASTLDSAIGQAHSQGRLLAKFRLGIHKECSLCTPDQEELEKRNLWMKFERKETGISKLDAQASSSSLPMGRWKDWRSTPFWQIKTYWRKFFQFLYM